MVGEDEGDMVGEVGLNVGESDGLGVGLPVGLCVISGYELHVDSQVRSLSFRA